MKRALVLCLLAACGNVTEQTPSPADAAPDAAPVDSLPDAFVGCLTDEFTGTTLAPDWNDDAVGAAPTITMGTGVLTITDAAAAPTVVNPNASWVYDLDSDKGNQMRWAVPIGTRDFALEVTFGWNSLPDELTLAGVAVVDGNDHIEAFAGVEDGHASAAADKQGAPTARMHGAGEDADKFWSGAHTTSKASHTMAIIRTGGLLIVRDGGRDGELVLDRQAANLDLQGISIVTVKHISPTSVSFAFGEATVDRVSLCFP